MKENGSAGFSLMVALMASSTTFCRLCSSMYWAAACGAAGRGGQGVGARAAAGGRRRVSRGGSRALGRARRRWAGAPAPTPCQTAAREAG